MSRQRLHILINPISGSGKGSKVKLLFQQHLDQNRFDPVYHLWNNDDDLVEFENQVKSDSEAIVVAVGGDGTVNEVCSRVGGKVPMVMMPTGSGNGLSRQMGYPSNPLKWITWFNNASLRHFTSIDIGKANDKTFVNVSGVGFDAHIGHVFATMKKRGLLRYIKAVLQEFRSYKEFNCELILEDKRVNLKAFLISVANGNQWGNEFYIAPNAVLDDALLDVIVLRKPKWYQVPALVLKLRFKLRPKLITRYRGGKVRIESESSIALHCDGEPVPPNTRFNFELEQRIAKFVSPK